MKKQFKMNRYTLILAMLGWLAFTSCEEETEPTPVSQETVSEDIDLTSVDITLTEDIIYNSNPAGRTLCSGSATLTGVPVPNDPVALGDYCFQPRLGLWTISCGPAPLLAFEGQFNSFIRPVFFGGWFVGTVPTSQFNDHWSALTITPKASDVGNSPNDNCGTFIATPDNVLGVEGEFPAGSGDEYGEGYYTYVFGQPTPQKSVVVWQGGSATNPAGATVGYVLRINALNAIPTPPGVFPPQSFTPEIVLDFRRAL